MRRVLALSAAIALVSCAPPTQTTQSAQPAGQPGSTRVFDIAASATIPRIRIMPGASGELSMRVREGGEDAAAALRLFVWDTVARKTLVSRHGPGTLTLPPPAKDTGGQVAVVLGPPNTTLTVELALDARSLATMRVETRWLDPPEHTKSVVLARRPGQHGQPWLYLLDDRGKLLDMDVDSGPVGLAAMAVRAGGVRVAVGCDPASPTCAGGTGFRAYANDAGDAKASRFDRDGDGLGQRLEAALGTCDSAEDPPCNGSSLHRYYRSGPNRTADTDRDGLSDRDELLGVGPPQRLDLPGWGADPLHKDVFVEVDYRERMDGHGLGPQDLETIAALYARGSAEVLRNPDGRGGVHLHLDVGFAPTDPAHFGLFGDWGGSGPVSGRPHYVEARKAHFDRKGFFRYALAKDRGTGTSALGGDAFQFNRHFHRALTFAHELGHTMGLHHFGHGRLGNANCKPHYRSIMNYAYQKRADVGFYAGEGSTLNPAHVVETDTDTLDVAGLRLPPFELDATTDGIDWNRDGRISTEPVRAAITWATHKGCEALGYGRRELPAEPAAVTPRLVPHAGGLWALWVGADGRTMAVRGEVRTPNGRGQCVTADANDGDRRLPRARRPHATRINVCIHFGASHPVEGLPHADAIAVAGGSPSTGTSYLGVTDNRHRLWIAGLQTDADTLLAVDPRVVPGAHTRRPAALHASATSALRVLWLDEGTHALRGAVRVRPGSPWVAAHANDRNGNPLVGALGPSMVGLPSGEVCGIFPDPQRFIRLFCLDASDVEDADARWRDLSRDAFYAGMGPVTESEANIVFHRYLSASGYPIDGSQRGALHVAYTRAASRKEPLNPQMLISEWLDAAHTAAERVNFRWRGSVINEWANLAPTSALALHPTAGPLGLTGLAVTDLGVSGEYALMWLAAADGAFDTELSVDNDFAVMERGICRGLGHTKRCGGRSTATY